MKATNEQHQAIYTHDRNVIVVAGAGSGKTRVLVERYLALLSANTDWSLNALVAITFTRKAAGEMRDRVRATLEKNRRSASNDLERQRWTELLGAMDSARIDTIHGLCAQLLRANAAEAGLDPDFIVLDETDGAILLSDVIDDALAAVAAGEDAESLQALALFDTFDEYVVREVLFDPALMAADIPDLPENLMAFWQAQWLDDLQQALDRFSAHPAMLNALHWGLNADMPRDDLITDVWLRALDDLQTMFKSNDLEARYHALTRLESGLSLRGGSAKAWGGKDAFDEAKNYLKLIRAGAADAAAQFGEQPNSFDEAAAELLPCWLSLIRRVQRSYRDAKKRLAALDFDDLEKLTCALLEYYPDVVSRYRGAEFRHLLVDEFQDTNAAQWKIAQALSGLDCPGSLFVVGDPKQSIYAFRGADVSVFESVRQQIESANGVRVSLAQSFRTHAPLVDHFNALFGQILTRDEHSAVSHYQVVFEAMSAFRADNPHGAPPVELLLIDKSTAKDAEIEARRWEAYALAKRLQGLFESGHRIYDKEHGQIRPVRYGDMALLFQSMSNVTLYEDIFRAVGVPFITIAGRGYYNRQEVWDLLNLLRALHNPADNLSLASALRSPLFALSDDALFALRLTELPLWDALDTPNDLIPEDEIAAVAFARDCLYRLQQSAGRVTISELLHDAVASTAYLATLSGLPNGAQRRGNVEKLLDLAQSSGKVTLSAFSYYLHDLSTREVREGDAALEVDDVVRLMTVHASKGLEFPVVALVDCSWTKNNSGRDTISYRDGLSCKIYDGDGKLQSTYAHRRAANLEKQREDAERRRLLYVAATRAQDTLIICGQANTADWKGEGWLKWLMEIITPDQTAIPITIPDLEEAPAPQDLIPGDKQTTTLWDHHLVRAGKPLSEAMTAPGLMGEVIAIPQLQAKHLAATAIAHLGGLEHAPLEAQRQFARDNFRRQVLYDAPASIKPIYTNGRQHRFLSRQVGEIVHEALRWWDTFEGKTYEERRALLESYAWEQGITSESDCAAAVRKAEDLLNRFTDSQLFRDLRNARVIYREMPFVYERDTHIIHGIIDVLFQRKDGSWVLADYKTSTVRPADHKRTIATPDDVIQHARQYHLQVAVYAEAVSQQLKEVMPEVMIHYIRYNQTVPVPAEALQAALAVGIGTRITQVMEG